MLDYELYNRRLDVEQAEDWDSMEDKIPYITFPPNWRVKVIPPMRGAMARFLITLPLTEQVRTSVYLDTFDRLGVRGSPYWEVYPYNDDTARYDIDDTAGLLAGISKSLSQQVEKERLKDHEQHK